MGRVTGTRRLGLTAALFAGALVFLVVAISTHSAVPLFVMWVPLLAVPLVLARPDRSLRRRQAGEPPESNRDAGGSETTDTSQA